MVNYRSLFTGCCIVCSIDMECPRHVAFKMRIRNAAYDEHMIPAIELILHLAFQPACGLGNTRAVHEFLTFIFPETDLFPFLMEFTSVLASGNHCINKTERHEIHDKHSAATDKLKRDKLFADQNRIHRRIPACRTVPIQWKKIIKLFCPAEMLSPATATDEHGLSGIEDFYHVTMLPCHHGSSSDL